MKPPSDPKIQTSNKHAEPSNPADSKPILFHCPILDDLANIQDLSKNLAKAMRRLRRDLNHCKTCASAEDCPTLRDFNASVKSAMDEINEEWNLSAISERTL